MFDGESIVVREFFHVALITAVVTELVTGLGNADLGYGEGISFSSQAEGGDPGDVGLKGENHQVINRTEVIPRLGFGDFTVGAFAGGV